ncbi:MAG TPA: hypothetical protein VLL27_05405 [Solirubrobacterales bacterium]|nr:hypothetical protein [Solirubrobacterales bacterium]
MTDQGWRFSRQLSWRRIRGSPNLTVVDPRSRSGALLAAAGEDDDGGKAEGDRGGHHHDRPAHPRIQRAVEK